MSVKNEKCVIIINENLRGGTACNTAAILAVTIGEKKPYVVGADVSDSDGNTHSGIIQFPVPVLCASENFLKTLRAKLFSDAYKDLFVVDFTDTAQKCKTYDEFIFNMAETKEENLNYLGIALCGNKKKINSISGNLPLFKQ